MPQARHARTTFNRGIISPLAGARVDLERHALSADRQVNFVSRTLGSMMLRPGLEYIGATASNDISRGIAFVRATDTVARLEITENGLRVWVDDELVSRETVTAAVTNGTFDTNLTGWTDNDESGGTSSWATGGYMSLAGNGTNAAIRDQQVTVTEVGTEHALRIVVERGPVLLRVGSTEGGDDYIGEATLGTGTHSLAFTPTGDFHIRLFNRRLAAARVDSVAVEGAGVLSLPVPWSVDELRRIRHYQSADVLFVACYGLQQRKIERRGDTSWSIVLYEPEDGPFRLVNTSPVTIAASAISGNVTLTASKALFRSGHVGALFRLTSSGQLATATLTGNDQFTDPIRIVGVEGQRVFSIITTGTWTGTLTLQYSVAEPGSWVDAATYTTNQSISYDDNLDNQVIYYRIGIKSGDYGTGSVNATLSHSSGSSTGIVRITGYTSATSATAAVLDTLGGTAATSDWSEGAWSTYRGWPSAVALHEGRLWWFGKDKAYGSESDLYEDFDDTVEGDAGPIQRSIGEGPVDTIHWAVSLARLLIGTASMSANVAAVRVDGNTPIEARSSSFDEPLTPTNFNLKRGTTKAVYVDRSGQRLYETGFDLDAQGFSSTDLTLLVPDLNEDGIVGVAVQHKPDVRLHCWREDGTVGVLVFDGAENVICWQEVETDGVVEDVVVLPGVGEDQVYYTVKRTIDGATVRYHEKWALESQCTGRPVARLADSHLIYSGAAVTSISGLGHLEGESVVVWGWNTQTPFTDIDGNAVGRDLGTYTVSDGAISGLPAAVTDACVGLPYEAQWRGTRNAFGDALGTPLVQPKRMEMVGLVLHNTHGQGLRYGQDLVNLSDLPQADLPMTDAGVPDTHHVWADEEIGMLPVDGQWGTDSRLCLAAASPRPCTVLAAVIQATTNG
jgi:hypothetical protein